MTNNAKNAVDVTTTRQLKIVRVIYILPTDLKRRFDSVNGRINNAFITKSVNPRVLYDQKKLNPCLLSNSSL